MGNSRLRGFEALAPHGLRGQLAYSLHGQRSLVPSSGIAQKVADAVEHVLPGSLTTLYSGQERPGAKPAGKPNRHPRGYAGDFFFSDPTGKKITSNVVLGDIAMEMAARHKANIGYSDTLADPRYQRPQDTPGYYMGPGQMHIDTMPLSQFPGGSVWARTAAGPWAGNLAFARATGIGPTPYTNAPTPYGRNSPRAFEAPTATGDFVNPNAPSFPARPTGSIENLVAQPSAFPARPAAPAAPPVSVKDMARAYGQLGRSLATQGVGLDGTVRDISKQVPGSIEVGMAPGTPLNVPHLNVPANRPASSIEGVDVTPGLEQTMALAPPQVPQTPMPPAIRQLARMAAGPARPSAPSLPSLRASDIYSGQIGRANATGGNVVSRDPYGGTSVTNQFGITTTSLPNGQSYTSRGLPDINARPGSVFDNLAASLRDRFGNIGTPGFAARARMGVGTMAGGAIGSIFAGPVGAMLGGYFGNRLGGGGFPAAPGHFGESSGSAPSKADMDRMSPAASRAVSRGKTGGLY